MRGGRAGAQSGLDKAVVEPGKTGERSAAPARLEPANTGGGGDA